MTFSKNLSDGGEEGGEGSEQKGSEEGGMHVTCARDNMENKLKIIVIKVVVAHALGA